MKIDYNNELYDNGIILWILIVLWLAPICVSSSEMSVYVSLKIDYSSHHQFVFFCYAIYITVVEVLYSQYDENGLCVCSIYYIWILRTLAPTFYGWKHLNFANNSS